MASSRAEWLVGLGQDEEWLPPGPSAGIVVQDHRGGWVFWSGSPTDAIARFLSVGSPLALDILRRLKDLPSLRLLAPGAEAS